MKNKLRTKKPVSYSMIDPKLKAVQSCAVCSESRVIDTCHIIPHRLGGLKKISNVLFLCPTHHQLMDRFLLTKEELFSIDINNKSNESIYYFKETITQIHAFNWDELDIDENERLWNTISADTLILHQTARQIVKQLDKETPVLRPAIYDGMEENLRDLSKQVVVMLIDSGVVSEKRDGHKCWLTISRPDLMNSPDWLNY